MAFASEKQILFNYGWEHFWCDPENLKTSDVRQFIRGPFVKPKLVHSVPFIMRCQYDGIPVKFSEGIPDCWAGYLAQKLRFLHKCLRNYELMQREDEDIISHLRQHRLYLGQGIPDPWMTYPYANNLKTFPHLEDTEKRKYLKKKKERCLCCEREYLFGCPDKSPSKANRCSCNDCHSKIPSATDSVEKCRCSEIFHNWLLENATFNEKKKRNPKGNPSGLSSPNGSNSESDDEGGQSKERNKFLTICECLRNRKGHDCSAGENPHLGSGDHENLKFYFCPYIKNLYGRKSLENESSKICPTVPKPSVSKEIQAEIKLIKYSKTVQTDESEIKPQPKCNCHNKFFRHCTHHCNRSWVKPGCPVIHTIPSFFCTSNFTQNPTLACPYSIENHFTSQKPYKNETGESKKHHKKNKQPKRREQEGSYELRLDRHDLRGDGDNTAPKRRIKGETEEYELTETPNYVRYHKNIINCQPPPKSFDHLKYFSDYKLKDYLQQEVSPGISGNKFIHQNTGSKFINYCGGHSSLNNLRQEGNPLERFRSFSFYRPKYSESPFAESKINLRHSNFPSLNIRRYNYSDQATMTSAKEAGYSGNDNIINKHVSNNVIEGEESRDCDYIKNEEVPKVFRKRRKLLRNRKRRRKLVSSVTGYQDFLTKGTIPDKDIQDDKTTHHYIQSKKMSPKNFSPPSDPLNLGKE